MGVRVVFGVGVGVVVVIVGSGVRSSKEDPDSGSGSGSKSASVGAEPSGHSTQRWLVENERRSRWCYLHEG